MGLKITNSSKLLPDGTYVGARGGTELMMEGLRQRLPADLLDKFHIVASRVNESTFASDKRKIFWAHDLAEDWAVDWIGEPGKRSAFDKLVFVSNWQLQQYNTLRNVPYSESVVLQNAIVPIPLCKKPEDRINLIYHTTPHRGLEIVVPVFEKLYSHFGDSIHLDVYSSFKIYGWEHRDVPYKDLFDRCDRHPGITNHGTVSNEEIREALQKAHIFAFPSIWKETSCIAAIEAMSAGCAIVAPNLAALPETLSNFGAMYQYNEDKNQHARQFASVLAAVITEYSSPGMQERVMMQKAYVDSFYDWELRKQEWHSLLTSLL